MKIDRESGVSENSLQGIVEGYEQSQKQDGDPLEIQTLAKISRKRPIPQFPPVLVAIPSKIVIPLKATQEKA
jgi:hypothetical protein